MQPSSKTPRIAWSFWSDAPSAKPRTRSASSSTPNVRSSIAREWLRSWSMRPDSSQRRIPPRANPSWKSSLQIELYGMPAFASDALTFSMPTSPGQRPLQLASVRIGPRCFVSPASTWLEYSHTASATMSGASRSILRKSSMPRACPSMKPCFFSGSYGCPRTIRAPESANAAPTAVSSASCAGQQRWFAESRESPLATRMTSRPGPEAGAVLMPSRAPSVDDHAGESFRRDDGGILCRDAQREGAGGAAAVGMAAAAEGAGVRSGFVRVPAG